VLPLNPIPSMEVSVCGLKPGPTNYTSCLKNSLTQNYSEEEAVRANRLREQEDGRKKSKIHIEKLLVRLLSEEIMGSIHSLLEPQIR
jgi:hypothetical protein